MTQYCQIGENRPGAGVAWVQVTWDAGDLPKISFCGSKEPRNKILTTLVHKAIEALIAGGHLNLLIEAV